MVKTEREYREDIVEVGRLMFQKGWVAANDGNVSIRLDAERILCKPSRDDPMQAGGQLSQWPTKQRNDRHTCRRDIASVQLDTGLEWPSEGVPEMGKGFRSSLRHRIVTSTPDRNTSPEHQPGTGAQAANCSPMQAIL
jgi:hypothetical protein